MKEIKRYNPTKSIHDNGSSESCECNSYAYCEIDSNGDYVEHSDYLKEVEQLQARIKELESVERVNEIKANAIIEAINCDMDYVNDYPIPRNYEYMMVLLRLNTFAGKLRAANE